jgi:hypothetical protein
MAMGFLVVQILAGCSTAPLMPSALPVGSRRHCSAVCCAAYTATVNANVNDQAQLPVPC